MLVFPIVWATLEKSQQINLAKPIISLLSKEQHQRQAMNRPNIVQVGQARQGREAVGRRCWAWQGQMEMVDFSCCQPSIIDLGGPK